MLKTDICIVGAGPGGCAVALKLRQLGIPSVLLDKATFPRDKICGDAISTKAVTILRRIDPDLVNFFEASTHLNSKVWGMRFGAPNGKQLDIPFRPSYNPQKDTAQGFVSKRIDFDNYLVEQVKCHKEIDFHDGIAIENYELTDGGYLVSTADGSFKVLTKLLIVANGAHSSFSRHHVGLEKDERHHAGAVRAYYRNVEGLHPDGFIELHFLKEINPGYFWIFALPGGHANVGLGMRSDFIRKRRYNLTKGMQQIIAEHPVFRERFKDAEQLGKITGYGLPLGSKRRTISGERFLLVGDAGHLIDPLSGEGIGNALYSGLMAAEQAKQCLESKDFSAEKMAAYDARVARVLGKDMDLSYFLQRMMTWPWLLNFLTNRLAKNPNFCYLISDIYNNLELRKKAKNPMFWVKRLLKGEV